MTNSLDFSCSSWSRDIADGGHVCAPAAGATAIPASARIAAPAKFICISRPIAISLVQGYRIRQLCDALVALCRKRCLRLPAMRNLIAACLLGLLASLSTAASAAGAAFEVRRLDPSVTQPNAAEITRGARDDQFLPATASRSLPRAEDYWLRLTRAEGFLPRDVPTVTVRKGRNMD